MSKPMSENPPVLESGVEFSTISDDAQMQVDPAEPADDRTVPEPANSQPASEPGSTTTDDKQTNLEDAEPAHARPRPRVRHVSPRSLSEIKSSYELVSVVYGAVHAHQQLYERADVLHGDINPNTILILDWPAPSSESPCARASESSSGAAPDSQSASASQHQPGGLASASDSEPGSESERRTSSSRHGLDREGESECECGGEGEGEGECECECECEGEGEGKGEGEGEGEGRTEGALVDFDVPYSAAAWGHPRPGPFKWENHSRLRMRRYGFY